MKQFLLWLRIVRPQTLFASFCPVAIGLLIARKAIGHAGIQGNTTALLTLLSALALQILSNLVNDYYDYKRGSDRKGRAGFKRALAEGEVTAHEMGIACLTALGAAIVTGAVLVVIGGWPILLVGLTALLFAWLYTATDHSLSYLGIADLFVFLYYGVIASCGTLWLQYRAVGMTVSWFSGAPIRQAFYAGAVCGLASMCVLAINNIRDLEDDRKAGKRTFPVRFGLTASLTAFALTVALMPVFAWLAFGVSLPLLIVIPGGMLLYEVIQAKGTAYNRCLIHAGLLNLAYVLLVWFSL